MTDPFKNQRYSSSLSASTRQQQQDQYANMEQYQHQLQQQQYQQYQAPESNYSESKYQGFKINQNLFEANFNEMNNLKSQEKLLKAHAESNKEIINQLKNNIELLFKGTRIVGQLAFYPLKALRWQCQINSESSKYHLTPFTLMPVIYNISYHGLYTLSKGCYSMAAYSGFKIILESVLSEVTLFEKNIEDVNKKEKFYGHVLLKFLVSAITTPIFSAVVYESVQSGISHENIGIMDLLRETTNRITGYRYNYRTRLIPFWSLIMPTSFYMVGLHLVSHALEKLNYNIIRLVNKFFQDKRRSACAVDEVELEVVEEPYLNALNQVFSKLGALVILYPVETIINRLIVQGTRTIIDNTDHGFGVIPINTRYEGFVDCAQFIHQQEGMFGFYKGIGALAFETLLHFALFKFASVVAIRIFDSEWTCRSDRNQIKNLMTSSSSVVQQYQSSNTNEL